MNFNKEKAVWVQHFNAIKNLDETIESKNIRLTVLLMDMEKVYRIPAMRDEDYERKNPELMEFYREVAVARVFLEKEYEQFGGYIQEGEEE